MDKPRVSVVTATYNWPDALREAISSVLAQTFTNFEHLVIGDCCNDNTEEVVAAFNDPRIRWHNLPENTGNQSGVNKFALEMARGDYIAYLNHDDLWFPQHLASLTNCLDNHDLDVVNSLALNIKPPGFNHRAIMGQPHVARDGSIKLQSITSSVMHTQRAAAAAGGWIDWRESKGVPTHDFFRRLRRLRNAYAVVNDISVLKFHSAERIDCYVSKDATEQARYARIIREDPEFRYREAMKALAYSAMRVTPPRIPKPEKPENAPEGWAVEQWRINRGLAPMLGIETPIEQQGLAAEQASAVKINADDRAVILQTPDAPPAQPQDSH